MSELHTHTPETISFLRDCRLCAVSSSSNWAWQSHQQSPEHLRTRGYRQKTSSWWLSLNCDQHCEQFPIGTWLQRNTTKWINIVYMAPICIWACITALYHPWDGCWCATFHLLCTVWLCLGSKEFVLSCTHVIVTGQLCWGVCLSICLFVVMFAMSPSLLSHDMHVTSYSNWCSQLLTRLVLTL